MSDEKPQIGSIVWRDLTVPDAENVKNFYCNVVGWKATPHKMGEYHDFDIKTPNGDETVAGICHARGPNANMPPQWMVYVNVEDVDASAKRCTELGGHVIDGPREMGSNRFCVIQDPAGAVLALVS
ncbi:MAG: VOC family protein [Phycisphaerales bacterium]|nr:VOC family protein [Phycisphaerales bacterium]